jgi:NAD(P)-dependent dehydrogenase (short-subunit alcohol dehydrogenase family)
MLPSLPCPQVDRLAEGLLSAHGCIHALVNSAALYPDPGKLDLVDGNPDAWEAALQ